MFGIREPVELARPERLPAASGGGCSFYKCKLALLPGKPLPNLPASVDEHRSLIALLIVSAFIVAGGIHYQTPMLAAIAAEFQADAATTGWIPTLSFGGMLAVSYTHLRAHETRHDLVC